MYRPARPSRILPRRVAVSLRATETLNQGRTSWRHHRPRRRPHQGGSHRRPDGPALVRSGSPTPTSPGWSSATSTPRAACSGASSSCTSRTARPTTPSRPPRRAEARRARPRRRHPRRHLQLHAAGHQGPGRGRGQDALHLPRAVRGAGVRSAHLLHRPGAGAAGRPVHPVADAGDRGEDVLPAVRRLHLAARDERARPGGRDGQRRGDRRRGVLPARPRGLPGDGRADRRERRGRGVQHDRAARGRAVPRAAARLRLRPRRAARLHVLRGELPRTCCRRRTSRGCTAASTTTRPSATRSARGCSPSTTRSIPATRSSPAAAGARASTAGCGSGRPPSRRPARSSRTT